MKHGVLVREFAAQIPIVAAGPVLATATRFPLGNRAGVPKSTPLRSAPPGQLFSEIRNIADRTAPCGRSTAHSGKKT